VTTAVEKTKKCAVCGKTSKHMVITSTSAFGSPDLDTRPPEPKRSSIVWWIQSCPSCGYCAPDISEHIEKACEVVRSDPYRQQLNSPEFPKLANAFLCYSLIQESLGKYASGGWASIYAAWACDDAGLDAGAQKCRKRALILLRRARENDQEFAEQAGAEEAIMVDLLRRSGQFELALKACDDGLKKDLEKVISDVLRFQKILIGRSDVACHSIAEATREDR
jgi:uncharacterized protein (DUF2225 family)